MPIPTELLDEILEAKLKHADDVRALALLCASTLERDSATLGAATFGIIARVLRACAAHIRQEG